MFIFKIAKREKTTLPCNHYEKTHNITHSGTNHFSSLDLDLTEKVSI